ARVRKADIRYRLVQYRPPDHSLFGVPRGQSADCLTARTWSLRARAAILGARVVIDRCRRRRILSRSIHMKGPIIAALLATAVTLPAFAALKQGDAAPEFSAQASLAGKTFAFSLADARRHGPVVVYFYPA